MRCKTLSGLLITLCAAGVADADPRIGLSFDLDGTSPFRSQISGFEVFSLYVIGHEMNDVKSAEFGVRALDPSWTILERIVLPVGAAETETERDDDWLISLGACFTQQRMGLAEYRISYMQGPVAPEEAYFCLSPVAGGSSAPSTSMGYQFCGGNWWAVDPSADAPQMLPPGCAVVNSFYAPQCPGSSVRFNVEGTAVPRGAIGNVDVCQFVEAYSFKDVVCDSYAMASFRVRVRWDGELAQLVDVIANPEAPGVQLEWSGSSGDIVVQGTVPDRATTWGWPVLFSLKLQAGSKFGSTTITLSELSAPGFEVDPAQLVAEAGIFRVARRTATESTSIGALKARY